MSKGILYTLGLLTAVFMSSLVGNAQSASTATIIGTVGDPKGAVGWREIKETWRGRERDVPYISRHRQQAVFTEERDELIGGTAECDQIDERERPLEQEPGDGIAGNHVGHRSFLPEARAVPILCAGAFSLALSRSTSPRHPGVRTTQATRMLTV